MKVKEGSYAGEEVPRKLRGGDEGEVQVVGDTAG